MGQVHWCIGSASWTETTAKVAEELADSLRADIERIEDARPRGNGLIAKILAYLGAMLGRTPKIKPPEYDPSKYTVVVVGSPIWAGTIATPVRTYLAAHGGSIKNIAFFLTRKRSRARKAFQALRRAAGKQPVATFAIGARQANRESFGIESGAFVRSLQRSLLPNRKRRAKAKTKVAPCPAKRQEPAHPESALPAGSDGQPVAPIRLVATSNQNDGTSSG